jgi:hypothetical protein
VNLYQCKDYRNQRTISSFFILFITTAGQRTILQTIRIKTTKVYKHYDIQVHHTVILPESRLKAVLTHSELLEQKLVAFFPCIVQKFTILQFFFYKSFLNLSKPWGVNAAKADRTMMAQSEKSIICKKPRLTVLHAGIVLTPPLMLISTHFANFNHL